MAIYTSSQLLSLCNAEQNSTNTMIAQTIINIYMQAKNFYQENMVDCMKEFLTTGILNFSKYNIKF